MYRDRVIVGRRILPFLSESDYQEWAAEGTTPATDDATAGKVG